MEQLENTAANYEVLVVGGGINGAGIAQNAAGCGYKTLIIEQHQFGSGTSSKSSKLIHGGLRYLQSAQLRMVYESLRERKLLLKLAPQLVKPNHFYIPIYTRSKLKAWYICIGLFVYYLLSGFSATNRFRKLKQKEWQTLPHLNQKDLQAVLEYQDCQTDDQALTQAVTASAGQHGADCLEQTSLLSAEKTAGGYLVLMEQLTEKGPVQKKIFCKVLINATGPWINKVASKVAPAPEQVSVDLVQGSHLVLAPQLSEQCFYLEAPTDGRAVFVLPWHGQTLLGTTETDHHSAPEDSALREQEKDYLLGILNHYFPEYKHDVVGEMSGLRVLPHKPGSVHTRSREVVLLTDNEQHPHYIGIYGGKLTTYRSTAEKVIKLAEKTLGAGTNKPSITRQISLQV